MIPLHSLWALGFGSGTYCLEAWDQEAHLSGLRYPEYPDQFQSFQSILSIHMQREEAETQS